MPPGNYTWFGWYGFNATAQAGWVTSGISASVPQLIEARSLGVPRNLLSLESQFLHHVTRDGNPALALRADWRSILNASASLYTQLMANGTIHGFFFGDELMWNGLPYAELVEWSDAVRVLFPDAWLWENEATPVLLCDPTAPPPTTCHQRYSGCCDIHGRPTNITNGIPPALSSLSIDKYDWRPKDPPLVPRVQAYYDAYLKPRLHPGQTLWLVPGSAADHADLHVCNTSCQDALSATDAWSFYNWTMHDPLVTGMVPWPWFTYPKYTGTEDLPLARAAWELIGRRILGNNTSG